VTNLSGPILDLTDTVKTGHFLIVIRLLKSASRADLNLWQSTNRKY
jgi:hypothetical protein